jgi:hypothetical protein
LKHAERKVPICTIILFCGKRKNELIYVKENSGITIKTDNFMIKLIIANTKQLIVKTQTPKEKGSH